MATWVFLTCGNEQVERRAGLILDAVVTIAGQTEDFGAIQGVLDGVGGNERVESIVLVGGSPLKVLAAKKHGLVGIAVSDLASAELRQEIAQAIRTSKADGHFHMARPTYSTSQKLQVKAVPGPAAVLLDLDGSDIVNDERAKGWVFLSLYVVVVGLVIGAAIWHLQRHAVAPIRRIENAVARRAAGDTSAWAQVGPMDEIGRLATSMNAMLASLDEGEANLRQSEAKFKAMSASAPIGVFCTDRAGACIFANPTLTAILGWPAEKLGQDEWTKIVHPDDLEVVTRQWKAVIESGGSHDLTHRFIKPDGSIIWASVKAAPIVDGHEMLGYVGTIEDVTIRHQMVEQLQESEERFRQLTEAAQDAVIAVDQDCIVTVWNPAAERMFGYLADEAAGRYIHDLIVPEGVVPAANAGAVHFATTGTGAALGRVIEVDARHKDGHPVPIELALSACRSRQGWQAIGIARDISERRQAAASLAEAYTELENALLHANELAVASEAANMAKTAFLANMSHEIRTPLNGVLGMADLLMDTPLTCEQQELADTIQSSSRALLSIINDVLDYSKIEAGKMRLEAVTMDLRAVFCDTMDSLAGRAQAKGIELVCAISPEIPSRLVGDPVRVRQVLTNIVGNAIKFTDKGEVVARAHVVSADESVVRVRLNVQDTGIGIPAEKQQSIFERFTQADGSTTRKFGGTGLGLAITREIVDLMGGSIALESRVGIGSSFTVEIAFGACAEAALQPEGLTGTTVLVVDDCAATRAALAEMVHAWGCRVESAGSALEALGLLHQVTEDAGARIVLIERDLEGIGGIQLAKAIAANTALTGIRIALMTPMGVGWTAPPGSEALFAKILTKPIRPSALYNALAEMLDGGAEPRSPGPQVSEQTASLGLSVLVAEDNVVNQKVARKMLERLGCRVDVVGDGRQAVDALQDGTFDLVLMDCHMPVMDGYEATKAIRELEGSGGRRTRIIALTANAMIQDRQKCLDVGMDDYLAKPLDPKALFAALSPLTPATPQSPERPEHAVRPRRQFNLSALLDVCDGDREAVAEVLAEYVECARATISHMRQAAADEDWVALAGRAHELKGASGSISAGEVAKLCAEIEVVAKSERPSEAVALVESLAASLDALFTEIAPHLGYSEAA